MTARGVQSYAISHPGARRRLNEDRCIDRADIGLWAVADGVGGAAAGEVAAAAIADALAAIAPGLSGDQLLTEVRHSLQTVHAALQAMAAERGPGIVIASTAVVLITQGAYFACLWAGDSRAYLLRDGALQRLTRDHSLVQAMVDAGNLTEAESEHHPRANVITRAVGVGEAALKLDKVTGQIVPGDRFLLCSDGITKALREPEMAVLLAAPAGASPAELLIQAALAREASDNVTAVSVEMRPV
jgi:protein phosphatase/serine/threonine-protein phosphatase Stp1